MKLKTDIDGTKILKITIKEIEYVIQVGYKLGLR